MNEALSSFSASSADAQTMMVKTLLASPAGTVMGIAMLAILILMLISFCLIFKKAGYKWYEALVSGHNTFTTIVLAGKPKWYIFLFIVPGILPTIAAATGSVIVSQIAMVLVVLAFVALYIDITFSFGTRFKKGMGFKIGLLLLPVVFYPIIALGKSTYSAKGEKVTSKAAQTPAPKAVVKVAPKKIIKKK